ncbi:MAG: LamG domain-containing protein [Solirubrobacteraceae bacterium]
MRKAVFSLVAVIALAIAAPASASTSLSGWWPFYEGTGTTAHDLSGNHNDGTINGAAWTSGYFGPGLSFSADGFGNGQNVDIKDRPAFEPSNTVTVTAYVKASGSPGAYRYIVAKGGFGCTTGAYGLYTPLSGGLEFYVDHSDGVNYTVSPDAGSGVWDGNWHFVVGTYDGSAVHLYVDSAEVGTGAPNSGPLRYGGPTSNDLFIGHYEGCPGLDFTGSIDEPTVWSRALSANEVRLAYTTLSTLHRYISRLPSFPVN